jgi:hypothetical protein
MVETLLSLAIVLLAATVLIAVTVLIYAWHRNQQPSQDSMGRP